MISRYLPNKKEQLYHWIKSKGPVFTHEIIKWGTENYYNSADRAKRLLVQEGRILKISAPESHKGCEPFIYKAV